MTRKKKVESSLDDNLKKAQTPVVEQSATIETKEDELKETKSLVVRISKELEKRILNSSLHNQKSVHAALPKLVRLGLDSENEFVPKMDRKFSGAFVPFNTPSDFDKTYQNTVKSKMLTNNKSAFILLFL